MEKKKGMIKMKDGWSFNTLNTDFWGHGIYDTKEEAEKEAIKYAKDGKYNKMEIGECEYIPLPTYVDVDNILERLNEQYADEAGEEYDRDLYDGIGMDGQRWLESEMAKVIEGFHKEFNVSPNWFRMINIYTITVEEESE